MYGELRVELTTERNGSLHRLQIVIHLADRLVSVAGVTVWLPSPALSGLDWHIRGVVTRHDAVNVHRALHIFLSLSLGAMFPSIALTGGKLSKTPGGAFRE